MAISAQRDLVSSMKTETFLNICVVSKLQPMPSDLKQLFNKDTLEKLTQHVFNPLSYYLVSIVDPTKAASFSWPLYDTKTERVYRNELSGFIADYSGKGLLSPVMSSYLVNPACYKVTVFMFQLSQLAVQKILKVKMKKEQQKKLYTEMTEKYKSASQDQGFIETVERENEMMLLKLSNYLQKRKKYVKIAELFRDRITAMEEKLLKLKAQEYITNLVDSYVDDSLDEETKNSILEIKNLNKPAQIFDLWLEDFDLELDRLEIEWEAKMSPMVETASRTMELTKALIQRQTGEAEKSSYMIEYNHSTDEICTKDLEDKVNSQQKYILKNIVKQERLSFPNLIRGYVVAVSYILKNRHIGDGVYQFNRYLEQGNKSYSEIVEAIKSLMERVSMVESRLQPSSVSFDQCISLKEIPEIPPLPDLSDLTMMTDAQVYFDTFTPLGLNKHQLNLRKFNTESCLKPQNRSFMTFQPPRDDFLKNFVSGQFYERHSTHNIHNLSIISQVHARSNETIAECSSGFTKQQIQRLLSTNKKSSSTKKHKFKLDRPSINVKKGGLFNASNTSSENALIRCHSSPNLFENKDKQFNLRQRKLSIMQEGSPTLREVSGIMTLENKCTPEHLQKSLLLCDTPSSPNVPSILITPSHLGRERPEFCAPEHLQKSLLLYGTPSLPNVPSIGITPARSGRERPESCAPEHLQKSLLLCDTPSLPNVPSIGITPARSGRESPESGIASIEPMKASDVDNPPDENTPKSRIPIPVKKQSSIEKIINRFKKVRASVIQETKEDIKTITEEKENFNAVNVDVFTANKILLPDLLSPSCSTFSIKSNEFLEQICDADKTEIRKPRESLGTALGVDNTFLDQFDLID